jgi:pyridoxamine 5'-phosphate oxidase
MKFTLKTLLTALKYIDEPLDESSVDPDPIRQFQIWYKEARSTSLMLPESMTLVTVAADGTPSARMVLLKEVDERGFVFYTNYNSRKARELEENPRAALVFHWDQLQRQVRINGSCARISAEESDRYFATRPRESQIGAHASPQSQVVKNREELDKEVQRLEKEFAGQKVPRPAHWGGIRLNPDRIEFWKGRIGRLHDRLLYERSPGAGWTVRRLAP